ncbi:MAG: DUF805 domain-containing protein [Novosphingobium sp.]
MQRGTFFIAWVAACIGLTGATPAWSQAGATFQPGSDVGGTYQVHLNMFRGDCPPLDYSQFPFEIVQTDARTLRLKLAGEVGTATWDRDNRTFDGEVPAFGEIGSTTRPVRVNASVIDRGGERSATFLFRWRGRDCTATGNSEYAPITQVEGDATTETADGNFTVPPATVIGPAGSGSSSTPMAPASTGGGGGLSAGLSKWTVLALVLAVSGAIGWLVGGTLRRGRRSPSPYRRVATPSLSPAAALTPWQWATQPLRKYADFSGRAPRIEYWLFAALVLAGSILVGMVQSALQMEATYGLGLLRLGYLLAILVPWLAVAVRRLHDTDRSGVTLLVGLIPLIGWLIMLAFLVSPGTPQANRYGGPAA